MTFEEATECRIIGQKQILEKLINDISQRYVTWNENEIVAYLKHHLKRCEEDLDDLSKRRSPKL